MNFRIPDGAQRFVTNNASAILTAGGVVGTVATAVLAARGAYKYKEIVYEEELKRVVKKGEEERAHEDDAYALDEMLTKKERLLIAAPYFLPPVAVGGATIASIIFANRISAQRAAALAAAYGLSQKQLEEYRNKITQTLGINKEQKARDELAQERVSKTPGSKNFVIIEGGDVLFFDSPTGRYFKSSMEKVNRAVNSVNAEIVHHGYATASQFYDELELPPTTWTNDVGWNDGEGLLELDFSTVVAEDERTPCIVIDFKTLPRADYQRKAWG